MNKHSIYEKDIQVASDNWCRWKSVFEFSGRLQDNPLLCEQRLFGKFLDEYKVRRTIHRGRSSELRELLRGSAFDLDAMLSDRTGHALDACESALRDRFGTLTQSGKSRRIRSALSKIAAFLAPDKFIAYDQYGQKGLNRLSGRPLSYVCENYSVYIGDLNRVLGGSIGDGLRSACAGKYPTTYSAERDRFHRRVLDVSLMRLGGRPFRS